MEATTPSPDEQPELEDSLHEEPSANDITRETKMFEIAGFWRRFFAFFLDVLIFAIPLFIFGFVFRDFAFTLGPWGRLIGYGIMFLYWSCFNSASRNGQTIGKKLMKIAVVDSTGKYLSLSKSMLRAFILVLVGLLNQWDLPLLQNPVIAIIATTIIFGGGLALLYGLIFNRKTRQGIHDLIVGSYVVMAPPNLETHVPVMPLVHKIFTFGLVGVGFVLGLVGFLIQVTHPTFGILEQGEWKEIKELHTILSESDEFFTVGVQRFNRRRVGNSTVMKDLYIVVWIKKSYSRNPEYCEELLKQIARSAFDHYDNIDHLTGMRITLVNRFDFGLARGNLNRGAARTIEDWRKKIR